MSRYSSVLREAGLALATVLVEHLQRVELVEGGEVDRYIDLEPPQPGTAAGSKLLSLWLYFVTENEHAKNRPPVVSVDGTSTPPPLALSLHYLITPLQRGGSSARYAEDVLGAVLEAFHNRPIVRFSRLGPPPATEELHLSLARLSLEELTRVWDALQQPHRLSICLKANIVRIASSQVTRTRPVIQRDLVYGRRA